MISLTKLAPWVQEASLKIIVKNLYHYGNINMASFKLRCQSLMNVCFISACLQMLWYTDFSLKMSSASHSSNCPHVSAVADITWEEIQGLKRIVSISAQSLRLLIGNSLIYVCDKARATLSTDIWQNSIDSCSCLFINSKPFEVFNPFMSGDLFDNVLWTSYIINNNLWIRHDLKRNISKKDMTYEDCF